MNSKAKLRAVAKYNEKTYDRITLRLRKEDAEAMREHIGGGSVNGFITEAIMEKIEREKARPEIERVPFDD